MKTSEQNKQSLGRTSKAFDIEFPFFLTVDV